jgi:hypothetical protein
MVCVCASLLPKRMVGLAAMARYRPRKGELQRMKFAQPRACAIRHMQYVGGSQRKKVPLLLLFFKFN